MPYSSKTNRWRVFVTRSKGFKNKKKPASKYFTNKENAIAYFKSINQLWFHATLSEVEITRKDEE